MSASLSCGLIGAGWIGTFHGQTLAQRLPGVRLAAVADMDSTAVQRLSVDCYYADPLELIADPQLDAVAICSPSATHTDLVVAAAEAGKHVFCEKPMALALADADRAIEAARAAGVVLQVGFNRRFATDFAAMRSRIDDGVAEASFQAVYGYDVRGEVFGSGGVLFAGKPTEDAGTNNTSLFGDAYVAQFAHFADCIRTGRQPSVSGEDARVALEIALDARESVETKAPVVLAAHVAH
jgi:predicted dehydrogenase